MEVTALINIDSPTGRKLVREIEKHKKVAEIEYPLPEDLQNCSAISHNEVWDKVWDKLSHHYNVNVQIQSTFDCGTLFKRITKGN